MDLRGRGLNDISRASERLAALGQRIRPSFATGAGSSEGAGSAVDSALLPLQVLKQALSGIVTLINDLSQETVSQKSIFRKYRRLGFDVSRCEDILSLNVSTVDRVVRVLESRYTAAAAVEGGATGGLSVLGPAICAACIAADATALVALNLRALGEYATYYGFDIDDPQERLYALHVLLLASSWSDASKDVVLAQLATIARQAGQRKTWAVLEQQAMVRAAQRIAEVLGIRLTKAKLAGVMPIAGIAVGGGFNAFYTRRVCQEAPKLYRERFILAQKGLAPGV